MGKHTPRRPCEICGRIHLFNVKPEIRKVKLINQKSKTIKRNCSPKIRQARSQFTKRILSKCSTHTKLKKSNQTSCRFTNNRSALNRKNLKPIRKAKPCGSTKSGNKQATKSNKDRVNSGLEKIPINENENSSGSSGACESFLSSFKNFNNAEKIIKSSTSCSLSLNNTENMQLKRPNQASSRPKSRSRKIKKAWDHQVILCIKF